MIFDIIRNGVTLNTLISFGCRIFCIFCILPLHEFAHAFVATKLGDDTPRSSGRLTIDPMAHLDPIGAIIMVLIGIGYARPVPINPRNFRNPKVGTAITAISGPLCNLLLALIALNIYYAVMHFLGIGTSLLQAINYFLIYSAELNVMLAVFNLIPIAPLDGSRLLNLVLPAKYYFKIMKYERYIVWGIFLLIMTGALDKPLSVISGSVLSVLSIIAKLPYTLI